MEQRKKVTVIKDGADTYEFRAKSWCGNFTGFRVYLNGVLYRNHINALTAGEAFSKLTKKEITQ